jgi:hypothetical protein
LLFIICIHSSITYLIALQGAIISALSVSCLWNTSIQHSSSTNVIYLFFSGPTAHCGPGPPYARGFLITHTVTHQSRYDSSGRHVNTQHSQQRDTHAPDGIRTRNPSEQAAVDPRLRPLCHWDRQYY